MGGISLSLCLWDPPDIALKKNAITDIVSHCSRCFFHLWPPIWARVGPYGPIWTRMDPYIILYCVYLIYMWFLHCCSWFSMVLYMFFLTCLYIFWKTILHNLITFLDFFKDHCASPPAQKFALLCKFEFHFSFSY